MVLTLEAPSRPVHSRPRIFHKLLSTQVLVLLVAAVALRVWHLANVPGVNGDEAWYGARVMQVLHGEPIPWRTPTGNPINVFYFVPLLLLHAVFHPSFLLLRSVAVASGLAAIVANYFLCQRVFGKTTAVTAAILTAVLPINIAYSRFGWDACQSVLACTLVVYFALLCTAEPTRGCWRLALLLALISSIVVHPTNLLLAPIALVSLGYAYRDDLRHRLAISYLYDLPFGKGRQFLSSTNPFARGTLAPWHRPSSRSACPEWVSCSSSW
jgi:4-amino-4-deoxy-L-arabinose transferase-like glycosyltransferase